MVGNCLLDLFIYGSIPHDRLQSQAWDKWIHMHTYIYLGICMCACEWETERIDQELEKGRAISPLPALCVLSHIRLSVTPWTVARQTPRSIGILQARTLESVAMPSTRGSSQPIGKCLLFLLHRQVGSLPLVPPGKPCVCVCVSLLFWISFPFRSPQSTEYSSLRYTVGSH